MELENVSKTGARNTNLELYRIILMLLIVAHHYVVNSGILVKMADNPFAANAMFFYLFGAWGKTAINGFVMITGYFMCKSQITIKKFLKLIFKIETYNILIYFIFVISGYERITLMSFVQSVLPIKSINTDFTSAFLIFYLFIPFLNILLKNLNEKKHLLLVSLCLFLYSILGTIPKINVTLNYVSWSTVVYFISSYVRLYPKMLFDKTVLWGLLTIISLTLSLASIICCLWFGFGDYYFLSDSNRILAVVTAFCSFSFFKNINLTYNKFINTVASTTFGVLLIHANSNTMRYWLWSDTLQNVVVFDTSWCYLHFICSIIGVFFLCSAIDLLRLVFIEKPVCKAVDRVLLNHS